MNPKRNAFNGYHERRGKLRPSTYYTTPNQPDACIQAAGATHRAQARPVEAFALQRMKAMQLPGIFGR